VLDKLKFPQKTDRFLGSRRDIWCDFHRAYGHGIKRCITLSYQLANLVKEGFVTEYLEVSQEGSKAKTISSEQKHEASVLGELTTIAGGFYGGGSSTSKRKRYARVVMSLDARELDRSTELSLCFTRANLEDVFPHEDDPVVISVITVGRKVHKVLDDQRS